jgi:YfiH family protein
MITHADCQATIIYDPVVHVVANVHSGWRGSVQNIYQKTVDYLKQQHGCKAENLLACIGPSLGPNSSEFINFKTELPETFLDFQVKPFYFDFWAISRWQLKCAGLLDHHIECAQIDTKQDSRFFSHRRDKKTGRNAAMVILK